MPSFSFFEISSFHLIYFGNGLLACQKICKAWIKSQACWLLEQLTESQIAHFLAYFLSPTISAIIHIREIFSCRKEGHKSKKVKVLFRKYSCLVLILPHLLLPRLEENVASVSILKYLCIFVFLEKLSEGSILVFSIVLFNF